MTKEHERLARICNLYIVAKRRLPTINKELFPEKYEKCKQKIAVCELILARNGVTITL